jgi:pimeloyl-ACP methyl ester carboxylesterase
MPRARATAAKLVGQQLMSLYAQEDTAMSLESATSQDYYRFSVLMEKFDYDWDAEEVKTEDDYLLTTFRIKSKTSEPSKGTVLIQHGPFEDGASWIDLSEEDKSFHLQLVDQGYDVWVGNSRGTEYSSGHENVAVEADQDLYWDFTLDDLHLDDKANIERIKQITGEDKIAYIGYSQGTMSMNYALARDADGWYANNLSRVVELAPCFVAGIPDAMREMVEEFYTEGIATLPSLGINAINGPNWDADLQTICDHFGEAVCAALRARDYSTAQGMSVYAYEQIFQNALEERF